MKLRTTWLADRGRCWWPALSVDGFAQIPTDAATVAANGLRVSPVRIRPDY